MAPALRSAFEGLTKKYIDPSCRNAYSCEMEPLARSSGSRLHMANDPLEQRHRGYGVRKRLCRRSCHVHEGQIRKTPAEELDEKFVLGQAWDVGTCIAVQWPFLSFLALLLALELGFFVAVMVVNQMSLWNGDWKSSILALLFHGFGGTGDANKEGMSLSSAAMMLDAARQIKTRLEDCDGSWRLSEDI